MTKRHPLYLGYQPTVFHVWLLHRKYRKRHEEIALIARKIKGRGWWVEIEQEIWGDEYD